MSVPKFPSTSMSRPTSLPVTSPSSPSAPAAKSSKTTIASSTSRCGRAGGSCGALSELFGSWGQTVSRSAILIFRFPIIGIHFFRIEKKMGHTDSLTFTIQMVCPKYTYIQWEFLFPAGKFSSQPDLRFLTTWLLVLFRSSTLTTLVFSTQESTNRTAFTEMLKWLSL